VRLAIALGALALGTTTVPVTTLPRPAFPRSGWTAYAPNALTLVSSRPAPAVLKWQGPLIHVRTYDHVVVARLRG